MPETPTHATPYPGQERFVAGPDAVSVGAVDAVAADVDPAGFWKSAWLELRTKPQFIVAMVLLALIVVVVLFPGLFTSQDPHYGSLEQSLLPPSSEHWLGTDRQGYDIYTRTIYGARASVAVGVLTTIVVVLIGGLLGTVAVAIKHEIVLAIIGGLFVLEALSVIIQVTSYKLTGKRVFKMAPIHHHFEQLGWTEAQVVIRFWIIAVVLALIGLSTLKLR